jgi:phage shock protein A
MALITRLSRLFKADFHAVLDQVEEPELMLRQAIREMEEDLDSREQRIRIAACEQQEIRRRNDDLERSLDELDGQLDLCFESQKPELARNLVRRKLEAQRLLKHLAGRAAALARYLDEQRATMEEHRMTLDGLRQKSEILTRRRPAGGGEAADPFARELAITDDEVEVAFLREQSQRARP